MPSSEGSQCCLKRLRLQHTSPSRSCAWHSVHAAWRLWWHPIMKVFVAFKINAYILCGLTWRPSFLQWVILLTIRCDRVAHISPFSYLSLFFTILSTHFKTIPCCLHDFTPPSPLKTASNPLITTYYSWRPVAALWRSLLFKWDTSPVTLTFAFAPLIVTGQSTSTKLHLDLGEHYGLIVKTLSVLSGIWFPATALSWLFNPLDQFYIVSKHEALHSNLNTIFLHIVPFPLNGPYLTLRFRRTTCTSLSSNTPARPKEPFWPLRIVGNASTSSITTRHGPNI